ncbi:hypothetical protein AMELA_G00179980 [Ameiurus melas]|uniref:Kazal-like domain-containing protein n=1 Tax=Ameiurus melas TaxID=219545 RepID=A0A7J6ABZ6_AMEME|nr:hypothetical protein AMELA_G00179980 [Ameiurus melas]
MIFYPSVYRIIFLGLMTSLFGCSLLFNLSVIVLLRSQIRMKAVRPLKQTHQGDIELSQLLITITIIIVHENSSWIYVFFIELFLLFLPGIMNVPALALGIILGGFVMKKFQLSVLGAAKMTISTTFLAFVLMLSQYFLHCGNTQVAGLTVNYQGFPDISSQQQSLLSQCNSGCACSLKHWDPVCAFNGLTYSTPCLAGCQSSTGFGKEMVSFSPSNGYLFTPNSHITI